ncbi:MAG: RtcB family protein [Candidatus Micrarchaeota archaeon]
MLAEYGYYKKIKDFQDDFSEERLSCMDLADNKKKSANPILTLCKKADSPVLSIRTKTGQEILVSADHPLLSDNGFKEAGDLKEGDSLLIHPFVGIEYEVPKDYTILDEKDVINLVGNRKKLIAKLKAEGLLPLKSNSKNLPILAKLVGFITGDGWVGSYYSKKRAMDIWSTRIIGKQEDLEKIREDLLQLGYETNFIRTNKYSSKVNLEDGTDRAITGESTQLYLNSQSLSVLLHLLGVPKGNKSRTKTSIPKWVKHAPLWIKRLYLAGLFGAELSKPAQRKNEEFSFIEPNFSQNKIDSLKQDNLNFMLDLTNLLLDFGVRVNKIYEQKGVVNVRGERTHKLALRISAKPENLIRLWGTIGYEYCHERTVCSMLAISYLNYKVAVLEKTDVENEQSSGAQKTISRIRIGSSFPTFKEFIEQHIVKNSVFIKDEISDIKFSNYGGYVYDFTMNDKNHNFIANNIVSHNCGMRIIRTNLTYKDVQPKLRELIDKLFRSVPAGVGSKGFVKLDASTFRKVIEEGSEWCIDQGYGWKEDLEVTELGGREKDADNRTVSDKAVQRGKDQIGTLGSGNHYLEIQRVLEENIIDKQLAKKWGIFPDQIVVMFHCGSRGFGHQVATDYLNLFLDVMNSKYKIKILDRELACAPFNSPEGQNYFSGMKCAMNMSFANRQTILHQVRKVFSDVFATDAEKLGLHQIYDVSHNRASIEKHDVDGTMKELIVHRKGATAAFGPNRPEVTAKYREDGQPVIIGGSMETGSYLLVGAETGAQTWFTTAHGSGRTMSRTEAKRRYRGDQLQKDMEQHGILVKTNSLAGLAEEAGAAYKDIDEVIESAHSAGISKKVVKLIPIANVKG